MLSIHINVKDCDVRLLGWPSCYTDKRLGRYDEQRSFDSHGIYVYTHMGTAYTCAGTDRRVTKEALAMIHDCLGVLPYVHLVQRRALLHYFGNCHQSLQATRLSDTTWSRLHHTAEGSETLC